MEFVPIKTEFVPIKSELEPIKTEIDKTFECQACAGEASNGENSVTLINLFKNLTGIQPLCDDSEIIFCKNCQSTLEAFQLFKNLCEQTHEIFSNRLLNEEKPSEELVVHVQVEKKRHSKDVGFYICDLCQKNLSSKRALKAHFENYHPSDDGIAYKCPDCDSILSSLKNLKRHRTRHNAGRPFECSECDMKFGNKQNLYYHVRYVHKTGKKYVCAECGYVCYNPTAMNQHNERHHSTEKFRCDKCPKECKTRGDLREHKLVHENLPKTVPCPECGAMFKHIKQMRTHVRAVHAAKKKFVCETCSKGFVSRNALERHFVTHTGERKFPCSFCGQAFTQQQALKRHLTTHTGIRPHACPHCNHTFAEKFYMKKHAANCSKKEKT
ncbi:oocyte zinc finger protein XlCOF6.1-like [Culicoides brevitarsis]|uniref:oocyte zinc finger protein XlCOF6.1-like n=1 Tax=Culicoides brevitarsis TaxID=469753 RepID=UPI00307B8F6D